MTVDDGRPTAFDLTRRGALRLAVTGFAAGFVSPRGVRVARRSGVAFGTAVTLTIAVLEGEADNAFAAAFSALRGVERAASLFDVQSELSRLNRLGRIEDASADFLDMAEFSLRLAAATDGAFDPTVQPLWGVWADASREGRRPTDGELRDAAKRVGWRGLGIDGRTVRLEKGMAVTFNAVAQGLGADRALAALATYGVTDALVDTGEFGAHGHHPDGRPWRLAVADPRADRAAAHFAPRGRRFLSTSADNATRWTADFSEHHIVEPWSGHSPRELAEVAVAASSGMMADGLSTAVMVLSRARAHEALALDPDASALLIGKDGACSSVGREFLV